MSFVTKIEVDPVDLADLKLRLAALRWKVLSPGSFRDFLFLDAQPYMAKRVRERFEAESDPMAGIFWKPLAPVTQKIRRAAGYGAEHPINVRTGRLKAYVTDTFDMSTGADRSASLLMPSARGDALTKRKFKHAQQGGVTKSGRPFPARPVIGLAGRDRVIITGRLQMHLERLMAGI